MKPRSPMYSFLFDRKSLILLLAGGVTAAGLIFFGGLLTGLQWSLPPETLAAAPPAPRVQPAALAERPCVREPAAPVAEPPAPSSGELWASTDVPQEELEPLPLSEPEPAFEEPAPAPMAQPAVMKAAAHESSSDDVGRYSIQVGAFRQAANSEKVIQDLRGRGYEPYVIEERGRSLLRTVRVGRYADRQEALRAASEFERSEGMDVIVRPL
ncbi:MAG TPA: SPOR domain-containing protein [Thermoanaerobaculia bacterium]|nr:SPOR domain-containing protein [Thermoanaerobaculia bacterium]